jgi:hypothetical protein
VAEQKYKSPEELGEAVGRKIEELFGGLGGFFADEPPQEQKAPEPPKPEPVRTAMSQAPAPKVAPKPVPITAAPAAAAKSVAASPAVRPASPAPEVHKMSPVKPPPARVAPSPAPAPVAQPAGPTQFENAIEQIEVIILNLEWEVNPESIRELFKRFKELERIFNTAGPARNILAMNMRVLPRFDRPESVPHPALLKLLQDSVTALKSLHGSPIRPPSQALVSSINSSYKQIMSAISTEAQPPAPRTAVVEPAKPEHTPVVDKMGGAVRSLEEVSQRLARILGVLRQGGDMSVEEMTRRLGTLEHLLSERVSQLSSLQKELSLLPKPEAGNYASERNAVLMFVWEGMPMAVPSSSLAGLYPITRTQAEQYRNKPDISLGSLFLKRLPLKKPANPSDKTPLWLVHFFRDDRNFFLLADRLIGYRRSPQVLDVENQARLKIGQTIYTLISRSMLR